MSVRKKYEPEPKRKKLVRFYSLHLDKLFPNGTLRREIAKIIGSSVRICVKEGPVNFVRQVFEKIRRREFRVLPQVLNDYSMLLNWNQLTEQRLMQIQGESSRFDYRPKISIIMPVRNIDEKWLATGIDSVTNQIYRNWELCIICPSTQQVRRALESYRSKDSRVTVRFSDQTKPNEALSTVTGDFVGFLHDDGELTPDALYEVARSLNGNPSLDMVYTDEDKKDCHGKRKTPFFKPDWSPDLLMSMNYISQFLALRKSVIERAGGLSEGFQENHEYDLILRVTEITSNICHVPKVLYSSRELPSSSLTEDYNHDLSKKVLRDAIGRRNIKGVVEDGFDDTFQVRYLLEKEPLVTIIIPTRNRSDLLQRCISSLESKTHYSNYEIIVIDNNSDDERTLAYLRSTRHKVLRFDEEFNFSKINNFAATYARGEHLLFLNNDTEVIDAHWLEAMLEHSQRPEVGVVGALLLYPSSRPAERAEIQHAGEIIGAVGVANHAFIHLRAYDSNYYGLHRVVRNCSAVTGACAMIKRKLFNELGGFDEKLQVAYGDIDLCLRVLKKGYRIIYTPYACMYHYEYATRGRLHPDHDEAYMIERWKEFIIKGDPYYNPNLTLLRTDYSIASNGSPIRPLSLLIDIYNLRPALRVKYPEAREGDYRRLIEWAATHGAIDKSVRSLLRPYSAYYAHPDKRQ